MYDLALLNASINGRAGCWNVVIKNGLIKDVMPAGNAVEAKHVVDVGRKLLMPGLIDAHVHTRDPGYTYKEDFNSATRAAAAGGITTIMAMPNTNPPLTTASALQYAKQRLHGNTHIDVKLVAGAVSDEAFWIEDCIAEGAIAVDVYDDVYSYGTKQWINLFLEARKTGAVICFYLMDSNLEALRKSEIASTFDNDIASITEATNGTTEDISVSRVFPLAAYFGVPTVIRMVSTKEGMDTVRYMKKKYPEAKVYVEVNVHYLYLTNVELKRQNAYAHIHPPLRTEKDIEGLWDGILDGTVDFISSDHAPHADFEKKRGLISNCASGMIGEETMLSLLLTSANQGKISYEKIEELLCKKPAEVFNLSDRGAIEIGKRADFTVVDTEKSWTVGEESYSKGAKSAFVGWNLCGKPVMTIFSGKVIMKDGIITD